jgi:tRNA dimethylallyltransferase
LRIWINSFYAGNKVLCILGPTASGKSALAMALAAETPGIDIISMDSALVYRGMDIGSAKPTRAEQQQVKHHLIDIIDPQESYSAARFVRDATHAAKDIRSRGRLPILVGGTMLYYKAYMEGLDDLPSAPLGIRQALAQEAERIGWPGLHQQLATIDPETAKRVKPNDAQRISRALELYRFTGKTMTALIRDSQPRDTPETGQREPLHVVALLPEDRAMLHRRIEDRFRAMLDAGFLDEVRALKARGDLTPEMPSMRCVGYRQAWDYLDGKTTFDGFVAAGLAATRQLAKRQITWIRSFHGIEKVDPFLQGNCDLNPVLAACRAGLN